MNAESFFSDIALNAAGILLIVCAAAAIIFPLIQSFSDPKKLIKPLIGVVTLGVLYLIGLSINGNVEASPAFFPLTETFPNLQEKEALEAAVFVTRQVAAALFVTTVLLVATSVGVVYTMVASVFR